MSNLQTTIESSPRLGGFIKVSKESISELHFPKSEVLFNTNDQAKRNSDLEQAIRLGNLYHSKVTIGFEDIEGLKRVETTVWGVTDSEVILKKNLTIPINRIVSINY